MTAHAVSSPPESRLAPVAVGAGVLAAAAAGWVVLAERMAGMDMTPPTPGGDPGTFGWFAVTWVAMTAAMMLPGSAPAVIRAVRGRNAAAGTAAGFVTAYGAVWLLAGLAGYGCVQAVRGLDVGALAWSSAGRYVAAAALLAAGLYQLTPVKRRWLDRCTAADIHPPRPGIPGAVRAGAAHGVCCVACCWTLMVALYALGIMSITWMVVLTILIAGERLVAQRGAAVVGVAAVLIVLGVGIAAGVGGIVSVPGPANSSPGHSAMGKNTSQDNGMGMEMPATERNTHDR